MLTHRGGVTLQTVFTKHFPVKVVLDTNVREQDLHRPPVVYGPSPSVNGDGIDRAAWAKLCNLQRRILPQHAPTVAGYRLKLAYRPAFAVTGDYHDFFPRPSGVLGTFVGDGSGHGPAASMLMAIMFTILRTHAIHSDPGTTLYRASALFHELVPSDLFMTGVYLVLEPGGYLSWAAAGHHPPLHVMRSGEVSPIDLTVIGSVLGLDPDKPYETVRSQIGVGDRILLFTDGLWEARNAAGEPFNRLRIGQHMQYTMDDPLDDSVNSLVASVAKHLSDADFEDDITILGIERTE